MSDDQIMYPNHTHSKIKVVNQQDENGHWRAVIVSQRTKFDEEAKHKFLQEYRKHAMLGRAAKAAGVTSNTVHRHMKDDTDFAEACLVAQEEYKDKLQEHHQDLVFNGVEKKTYDRMGNLVSEEVQYPIRLIELELKKTDPAYRDKREVDVTVSGGVLVAPADVGSIEDWESKFGASPESDQPTPPGQIIEGEATPIEE